MLVLLRIRIYPDAQRQRQRLGLKLRRRATGGVWGGREKQGVSCRLDTPSAYTLTQTKKDVQCRCCIVRGIRRAGWSASARMRGGVCSGARLTTDHERARGEDLPTITIAAPCICLRASQEAVCDHLRE